MNKGLEALQRLVNESGLVKQLRKEFDRSFMTTVSEKDGKLIIQFIEQDSGADNMTVADIAALLQTDRRTVRRMTEARAQRSSRHPIPFFKIHGKMLRFSRTKIVAWLEVQANEPPVFAPAKGRKKRDVAIGTAVKKA